MKPDSTATPIVVLSSPRGAGLVMPCPSSLLEEEYVSF
jgi:hypothetical protein